MLRRPTLIGRGPRLWRPPDRLSDNPLALCDGRSPSPRLRELATSASHFPLGRFRQSVPRSQGDRPLWRGGAAVSKPTSFIDLLIDMLGVRPDTRLGMCA